MLVAHVMSWWILLAVPLIPALILVIRYTLLGTGLFLGWVVASAMILLALLFLLPRDRWQAKEMAKGWQRWRARKAVKLQDGTIIRDAIVMRKRISGAWLYSRIED